MGIDITIVIVGCDHDGLTAAVACKKHNSNARIEILEQKPHFDPHDRPLQLHPSAVSCYQQMGLGEQIKNISTTYPSSCLRDQQGNTLKETPTHQSKDHANHVVTTHRQLCWALYEQVIALGIVIHYGVEVVAIEEQKDICHVKTKKGETYSAHAVIGADGGRSKCRDLIMHPQQGHYYTSCHEVTHCPVPEHKIKHEHSIQPHYNPAPTTYCGQDHQMKTVTHNETVFVSIFEEVQISTKIHNDDYPRPANYPGLLTRCHDWLSGVCHGFLKACEEEEHKLAAEIKKKEHELACEVHKLEHKAAYEAHSLLCRAKTFEHVAIGKLTRWFSEQGRCILIGNAAHAMPPHAGLNDSHCVETAYSLSIFLATIQSTSDVHSAAQHYEAHCKPRADQVSQVSHKCAEAHKKPEHIVSGAVEVEVDVTWIHQYRVHTSIKDKFREIFHWFTWWW